MNMDACNVYGANKLRLMNIPEDVDADILRFLFEDYGRILDIVVHEGGLGFVQMNTKKNCERAYQGLKTNSLGITVEKCPPKKKKAKKNNKSNISVGRTKLHLTAVPENIGVDRLRALCGVFGNVQNIVLLENGLAFVEMQTRKECQRAFECLRTNDLGITVEKCPKRNRKKTTGFANMSKDDSAGGRTELRLMKVPKNLDEDQLKSLCETFGSVRTVVLLEDGIAYVDMATAKDCQVAFDGLKANDYGFIVDICPDRKRKQGNGDEKVEGTKERPRAPEDIPVERLRSMCGSYEGIHNVLPPEDGHVCVQMDTKNYRQLDSEGFEVNDFGVTTNTSARQIETEHLTNTAGSNIFTGRTKLRLSDVPENVDAYQLELLCQKFGKVQNVVLMGKGLAFVEMETKKQCRSAAKSLKTNQFGIKVERCPKRILEEKKHMPYIDDKLIFTGESLRLKEIPGNVDVDQIKFLCGTFGEVRGVVMLGGGVAYVQMETKQDCTLVMEGLENNELGIIAEGRPYSKPSRKDQVKADMAGNDICEILGKTKLCLKDVPENIDVDELSSLFQAFGSVRKVELLRDVGTAYVQMKSRRACKRAYECFKTNDLGITVEKCLSVKKVREPCTNMTETDVGMERTKLRLTKVPDYIGVGQLRLLCECFGSVRNVVLLEDGLAFVEMDTEKDSLQVLEGFKTNDLGINVETCISLSQNGVIQKDTDYLTNVDDFDIVTGKTKLRLTNVPENISVGHLKSLCESYGSVLNVVLLEDGLGYIEMDTQKNCERALKELNASSLGIAAEKCSTISSQIRKRLVEVENYLNETGVFVGRTKLRLMQVPENIDADQLNSLCEKFGRVVNILFKDDRVAYVEMDTKGNCKKACEGLKAYDIGVVVEMCPSVPQLWFKLKEMECIAKKNEIGVVGRQKLRLRDVPKNMDADRLKSLFETFGSVFTVIVKTGGLAYVEMDSNMSCQRAYEGFKVNNLGITVERCLSKWQIWKKQYSCASLSEIISFCSKPSEAIDVEVRGKASVEPLEWRRESADKKLSGFYGVPRENGKNAEHDWRQTSRELQAARKQSTTKETPEIVGANNSKDMLQAEQERKQNSPDQGIHSVFIDWDNKIPKHVCITGYGGPNLLWVRSLEYELNEAYKEVVDKVNTLGKSAEPIEMLPSIGDFVIANFGYKSFRRAVVIHAINEANIIVKFLDSGSMRTKTLWQLRKYPEKEFRKTENLIRPIQLFRVPIFKLNFEATNLLNSYIRNSTEFELICCRQKPVREFILKEAYTGESINELLLEIKCRIDNENGTPADYLGETASSVNPLGEYNTGHVKNEDITGSSDSSSNIPQKDTNELDSDSNNQTSYDQADMEATHDNNQPSSIAEIVSELVFTRDIQWEMLPNDDYIPVYVADNSFLEFGVVSCIHLKKLETVKQFLRDIDDYARTVTVIHTPRNSEVCLALNEDDQKWYRAEFLENVSEDLKIKFIDLGCVKNVPSQHIRKYSPQLMRPCYTSTCVIQGLPQDMDETFIAALRKSFRLGSKIILDRIETVPHLKLSFAYIDLTEIFE